MLMSTHNMNKGETLMVRPCVDVGVLPSPFPPRSRYELSFFSSCRWSFVVSPPYFLDSCFWFSPAVSFVVM